MSSYELYTSQEMAQRIANRMRQLRLLHNWTQSTLASRSGVSLGSLRRFEQRGEISFASLLRLAQTLGRMGDFDGILEPSKAISIEELQKQSQVVRKRGRK